jgi:glucose-1-phosphate thymidylyltransferase
MIRKAILLAGGRGTRLRPLTEILCKQLLPVYDKPLIHYPLATLMLLGIKEILVITTPEDALPFQKLLGNGSRLGINLQYAVQSEPRGLAEALLIAEEFIDGESVCLALGDNILYWGSLKAVWDDCLHVDNGAWLVGVPSSEPQRFGVIEIDASGSIISLEEKPPKPKSNIAAIGLYFYDSNAVELARTLAPSARGELEITDLNRCYLENGTLKAKILSRGTTWLDAGTVDSLLDASNFIQIVEKRQGLKVACVEEVAFNMGFIDASHLFTLAEEMGSTPYGQYLKSLCELSEQAW